MNTDKYGQLIFSEKDLVELYLIDPSIRLKNVLCDTDIKFDASLGLFDLPEINKYNQPDIPIEQFDRDNQSNLYIPNEYKNFDIAKYILDLCKNDDELQRAGEELLLYQERDMFDLLRYLKYLVDTMRRHNIVWGVGRGSSVASFVLFLIGVHKINSLYYGLEIEEFLR